MQNPSRQRGGATANFFWGLFGPPILDLEIRFQGQFGFRAPPTLRYDFYVFFVPARGVEVFIISGRLAKTDPQPIETLSGLIAIFRPFPSDSMFSGRRRFGVAPTPTLDEKA